MYGKGNELHPKEEGSTPKDTRGVMVAMDERAKRELLWGDR